MPNDVLPDVHNAAEQASAWRLIQCLRGKYPVECLTQPTETAKAAQGSLLQYLAYQINHTVTPMSAAEITAVHRDPSIKATIDVIDRIAAIEDAQLSKDNKKRIFEQLQTIASLYPTNAAWEDGDQGFQQAQWSQNSLYDDKKQVRVMDMTPPAEALNLVCKGLLDDRCFLLHSNPTEDCQVRITNFCTQMLALKAEAETIHRQRCATRLQHELLNVLANCNYLENVAQKIPFKWVADFSTFLKEALIDFLSSTYKKNSQNEADKNDAAKVFLEWKQWQSDPSNELPAPILDWLQKKYVSQSDSQWDWKDVCEAFIKTRCKQIGINPEEPAHQLSITAAIEELEGIVVPMEGILPPTVASLIEAPLFIVRKEAALAGTL